MGQPVPAKLRRHSAPRHASEGLQHVDGIFQLRSSCLRQTTTIPRYAPKHHAVAAPDNMVVQQSVLNWLYSVLTSVRRPQDPQT